MYVSLSVVICLLTGGSDMFVSLSVVICLLTGD